MVAISNVGIDAILLGVRNRGAAVIACIGRHFCLLKHVGGDLCGLEPFARALEHGLKQMRLLPFPMGFGVHDDLTQPSTRRLFLAVPFRKLGGERIPKSRQLLNAFLYRL